MKTLILGGGWVGSRFCLKNPSTCITTARTREKLEKLTSLGINAVEFDLTREETWKNLPQQELVSATVITFALSRSHLPSFEKLFAEHIPKDKPVLCLGTTSVFRVGNHESVVDETTPLTGIGLCGRSMTDRIEGENWILSKGAAVLHLSGIVGDQEDVSYGEPRSVRHFIESGYPRNGLKLVNLIHVNDICKIIAFFVKHPNVATIQRVIVSCGAFRWQHFTKALGIDPLPEILPPDESMNGSKILSTAKLCSFLPSDYKWTLPVESVEPVSRGLPSGGCLQYYPNSAARNRQWELLKSVFGGKWQGSPQWYKSDSEGYSKFIERMKNEDPPSPSLVVPFTELYIHFLDADTGVWEGKGLHSVSGGEKKFPLSRKTINESGQSFLFEGVACQLSVDLESSSFGNEVNFIYERSRSMIVVLYKPSSSKKFLLDKMCISPYRCSLGSSFPLKPPQTEVRRTVDTLLTGLSDMTCRMQWMSPTHALDETNGGEIQQMPTKSMLAFKSSDPSRLVQSFDDDLLCSIPCEVAADEEFELVFGCRHTDNLFRALTAHYTQGKLERCIYETWTV